MPMNKLLSFFYCKVSSVARLLQGNLRQHIWAHTQTHTNAHTHTNAVPHTGQSQAPHQHRHRWKCLPTQKCILWAHAHALAAHTVQFCTCMLHAAIKNRDICAEARTHAVLSLSPMCYNEYWVIQRAPLQWVSWPVHVGSCLLWERRRFKGEHGSQQIHWNYCTEETANRILDAATKSFSSAAFSQSCWHNIFL